MIHFNALIIILHIETGSYRGICSGPPVEIALIRSLTITSDSFSDLSAVEQLTLFH